MAGSNPLAMSDEDFAALNGPEDLPMPDPVVEPVVQADPVVDPVDPVVVAPEVEAPVVAEPVPATEDPANTDPQAKPEAGDVGAKPDDKSDLSNVSDKDFPSQPPEKVKPADPAAPVAADPAVVDPLKPVDPLGSEPKAEAQPLNYAAIGEQIMKPFKANGQTITLKTPEEAVKLMQQGANYTRKMQSIQPHLKLLTMLEKNSLLDENRLSYLIDLDKKDPEAIKKLVKDAGIDPLEIDMAVEPVYAGGNHRVGDDEVRFRTALDDLTASDTGKASLAVFDKSWDDATKQTVWNEPSLLQTLHTQRETGIYDRISSEVERQRMLGTIAPTVPFIMAYQSVGTQLDKEGAFADLVTKANPPASAQVASPIVPAGTTAQAPQPVAIRAAAPKVLIDNGNKAGAASPTRSSATPAKPFVNPLAMSDEEFMAEFKGRLG